MTPEYQPMSTGVADELIDGLLDVADQQPEEIRERLYLAIKSGLYDLVSASPDHLVVNVRGIGELMVARVPVART